MLSKVRNVLVISIIGVLGGMIKNILLARELSKDELGLFFLLMTVVGFVYPLTLLGQHTAFVRFMSDKIYSSYNWKRWFLKNLLVSLLLTIVFITIIYPIYKINTLSLIFLLMVIFSSAFTDLFVSIYRAQGKYEFSIFIFQILSFILPIATLLLFITEIFTFNNVLIVFAILYFAAPVLIIVLLAKRLLSGTEIIPEYVQRDGMLLWGMDISFLIIISIDKFLIPKLVAYDALGEYFAIYSLMRGFDILLRAVEFVMFPHVIKSRRINLVRNTLGILSAGLVISALYIIFGDFLISALFKGKYTNSSFLVPYFCILGSIRLLHTVPYSIIGGYMRQMRLKQMFYINVLTVFLAILLSFVLIKLYGLRGAVMSSIVVWAFKTLAGFCIIWLEKVNGLKTNYLINEGLSSNV